MLNLYSETYIISSLFNFTKVIKVINLILNTLMLINVFVIIAMQLSSNCE